jgi:hypothetical protein
LRRNGRSSRGMAHLGLSHMDSEKNKLAPRRCRGFCLPVGPPRIRIGRSNRNDRPYAIVLMAHPGCVSVSRSLHRGSAEG